MNAWPTVDELKAWLAAANLIELPATGEAALLEYGAAVDAGLEAWEAATGYTPFMAAATDVTRYYTPDGSDLLDLRGGLVAAPTSVAVGYSPTSAGTVLTADHDYWLLPLNAISMGRPATSIRFSARQGGQPQSIVITGRFGYCLNGAIPEDAWLAVLLASVEHLLPQLDTLMSRGGLRRLQEGDVTYEYGDLRSSLGDKLARVAARYRRLWLQ